MENCCVESAKLFFGWKLCGTQIELLTHKMSAGVSHEPIKYPDMANLHPGQVPKQSSQKKMTNHDWLVVLTILKNMSQWEGLPSGKLSHNYGKSPCDSW